METRDTIRVDARAQRRLYVLQHLDAGRITADEAARILELSVRQVRRLLATFRGEGLAGLVHGNAGRTSAGTGHLTTCGSGRSSSPQTTYHRSTGGTWPSCSAEREGDSGSSLSAPCAGSSTKRGRAGPSPPSAAAPEPARADGPGGLLLQVDGSRHAWLEGRGPVLTLVGGIDDATSRVTGATFRAAEDAAGYFLMLAQTAHGMGSRAPCTPTATGSSSSRRTGPRRSPSSWPASGA